MANAYSLQLLSGSTSGRGIKVVQTATAGTLIHTAVSGSTNFDRIYAFAQNSDTTNRKLTIEFGGVTDPDDLHESTITAEGGWEPVIPGWPLNGGLVVRAFAATANVIVIFGYVIRITVT